MRILFSSNKNPSFITITEYTQKALSNEGQVKFFNDRGFIIPGRIRALSPLLHDLELSRLNKSLYSLAKKYKPDILFQTGGQRIFPETVDKIKKLNIKTALWTIDVPRFDRGYNRVLASAASFDYVFTGGSESYDILKERNIKNIYFLPFACDSSVHKPLTLSRDEQARYKADIVFVGTVDPELYGYRVKMLEGISDFDLSVWGPGSGNLSDESPLKPKIKGKETLPYIWAKIYAAAKMAICIHYKDPESKVLSYQLSPRVYEVLACRKLLFVDNQRDLNGIFEDKKHLVIFNDSNDLREKIKYYLNHPQERQKIAISGYREVLAKHTYSHRMRQMLDIIKKG